MVTRTAIRPRSDRRHPIAGSGFAAGVTAHRAGEQERTAMTGTAPAMPNRWAHIALVAAFLLSTAGAAIVINPKTARAATAVTTSRLNLRVGNKVTSKVKLVMPEGAEVDVLNRSQNGYYKVVYQGIRGYAHGDYLDFSGGGSSSG